MTQDFETWFSALRDDRKLWVHATAVNDYERGMRNVSVEKYADPSHFVFELLQNAEDAGATFARFAFSEEAITFEHDGREFTRDDIKGVTGFGNTTKAGEANKIGCFGIGFKSIFAVTERPEVHCHIEGRSIAFTIEDLVVPDLIDVRYLDKLTRIILPLSPDTAKQMIAKVHDAVEQDRGRCLLFLGSLRTLCWTRGDATTECTLTVGQDEISEIRLTTKDQPAVRTRFLILTRSVDHEDAMRTLSVKIALRMDDGDEVVSEPNATTVAVFFPTEDATGLHFTVHGPFQLTDNRANLKRNDAWNTYLIAQLAALLGESLPQLRDRGLIKRSFLEVLPNKNDDLAEIWHPLRAAVLSTFNSEALIPAHFGGHVAVADAVRGLVDIREFLKDEGLASLRMLPKARWVVTAMKSSRADLFLSSLDIKEWSANDFISSLRQIHTLASDADENARRSAARDWVSSLSDDQLQRLYLLLDPLTIGSLLGTVSSLPIVRVSDNKLVVAKQAYLPPDDPSLDEAASAHGLTLIKPALTRLGRNRAQVEQFLKKIGAKTIGERDFLSAILAANYAPKSKPPSATRHIQHLQRFLKWFAEGHDANLLKTAAFFRAEGEEGHFQIGELYVDLPYSDAGLSRLYDGRIPGRAKKRLWKGYEKIKRSEFLGLLKAIDAEQNLQVYYQDITPDHPEWRTLTQGFGSTRTTMTEVDVDFTIHQLKEMLALQDVEIAKLVWKTMGRYGDDITQARYAPNQQKEAHTGLSGLAHTLKSTAWIPTKDGSFRLPRETTASDLLADFSVSGQGKWLNPIGFAEDFRERTQEQAARHSAARKMGLSPDVADRLSELPAAEVDDVNLHLREFLARHARGTPQFPERSSANPDRRAARLRTTTADASPKAYATRDRSVRVSEGDTRQAAKIYLRDLYTNEDDQMICQGCQQEMPFRLASGQPYFEAPEFMGSAGVELASNHLALCPVCAAKWQYAKGTTDDALMAALSGLHHGLAVPVELAGEPGVVRFVDLHLADLRIQLDVPRVDSTPAT